MLKTLKNSVIKKISPLSLTNPDKNLPSDVDVIIIGAGLSGIGMACQLRRHGLGKGFNEKPTAKGIKSTVTDKLIGNHQYKVLMVEARDNIGGTWDLFKYPGVRSDSDMSTYGYQFRPWTDDNTLASGDAILQYLHETAEEYDIKPWIRFGKKVTECRWYDKTKTWYVTIEDKATGKLATVQTKFVIAATGYYDYTGGYRPQFTDEEKFAGDIIHPQDWQTDYDYTDKNVVIIGSGATAVTLVPAMADKAAHVTMLQRSPTYIASVPSQDILFKKMQQQLPLKLAAQVNRYKNIAVQQGLYQIARQLPRGFRQVLLFKARQDLKSVSKKSATLKDFSPSYNPWDERLCAVPDGDLFKALQSGKASVITDQIKAFDKTGIQLQSGKHLLADLVISATGLNLQMLGGATVYVNDTLIDVSDCMTYKGVLVSHLPNFAVLFGYINASWTIKIDLSSEYLCRLLHYMQQHDFTVVMPKPPKHEMTDDTVMGGLDSGYIRRGYNVLPKQGKSIPWRVTHRYLDDIKQLKFSAIHDKCLAFTK